MCSSDLQAIGVAIIAVLGARAVGIYGFSFFGKDIPSKWKHILYWGGLRGAIVLALAFSIPTDFPERERLLAMSFGVVLFTLLIQGFSMDKLVKKMQLINRTKSQEEYERRHARFVANRSASDHLQKMSEQGLLSAHIWQQMNPIFKNRETVLVESLKDILSANPAVETEELDTARREALRVQRATLGSLLRDGVISDEIYGELVHEVDDALTEQHVNWSQLLQLGSGKTPNIKKMMLVVIQEDDLHNTLNALSKAGFGVDQFPSTGGFLSRKNVTLMIGIPKNREKDVVQVLEESCEKRIEYLRSPLNGAFLPLSRPVAVDVGGATIFTFDIEAYHEF